MSEDSVTENRMSYVAGGAFLGASSTTVLAIFDKVSASWISAFIFFVASLVMLYSALTEDEEVSF